MSTRLAIAVALVGLLVLDACNGSGDCDDHLGSRPIASGFAKPCSPVAFARVDGGGWACCSDDPASSQGGIPSYAAVPPAGGVGEPLFSEFRNDFAAFGQCRLGEIDPADVFDTCLIPCNPRWSSEDVLTVCGPGQPFMSCCQTVPTALADCVSVDGVSRAVRGSDMAVPEDWVVAEPGTRQDPELSGCRDWATTENGLDTTRFRDCVSQLTSADQRGYCVAVESCPSSEDIDPCRAQN